MVFNLDIIWGWGLLICYFFKHLNTYEWITCGHLPILSWFNPVQTHKSSALTASPAKPNNHHIICKNILCPKGARLKYIIQQ